MPRFLGCEADQVAVDGCVQGSLQRRAGRFGHFLIQGVDQARIASAVQLVTAVFGLDRIAHRLAFMRQQHEVRAELLAVGITALEHAARAVDLDMSSRGKSGHGERAGHPAGEFQGQDLPVHGIIAAAINAAPPRTLRSQATISSEHACSARS